MSQDPTRRVMAESLATALYFVNHVRLHYDAIPPNLLGELADEALDCMEELWDRLGFHYSERLAVDEKVEKDWERRGMPRPHAAPELEEKTQTARQCRVPMVKPKET